MADLDDINAAQTVKVVGASVSGTETNAVNATSDGRLTTESIILGATAATRIGNVTDKLKVIDQDVVAILNIIASGLGTVAAGILKQNELAVTTKSEVDFTGTTYTVPTGKTFLLTSFIGSYDAQATVLLRLKKQTGGTGAFSTLFRITLEVGGQGSGTIPLNFGNGILVGTAGDVFKITIESSLIKGTVWAGYSGSEL
jgi:hypothetical protein